MAINQKEVSRIKTHGRLILKIQINKQGERKNPNNLRKINQTRFYF